GTAGRARAPAPSLGDGCRRPSREARPQRSRCGDAERVPGALRLRCSSSASGDGRSPPVQGPEPLRRTGRRRRLKILRAACRQAPRVLVLGSHTSTQETPMQFLSLYTPAKAPSGPPSAEHMAEMMKLMEKMTKAGVLVTTGGILSRQTGMKVVRKDGKVSVED